MTPAESVRQDGSALVRLEGVSKSYGEGGVTTTVLDDTDLVLERGGTTSLVGSSGSGKSTLLAIVAGLMTPDRGTVTLDGQDLAGLDDRTRARLRARRVGIVLQSGNLVPFLTASENVEQAVRLAGGSGLKARRRARDLLRELGLEHRLDHLPRRLSGGEAQRVATAVALANEPDLLLADEVTGELDNASAEHVVDVIFGAWRDRGLTVLLVTHSKEIADRAQRRLRLAEGRVRPA